MAVLSVWEKASIIRLGLTDLTPTRLESTQLPKRVCHDFHESDKLPSFIQGYIHSACYELKWCGTPLSPLALHDSATFAQPSNPHGAHANWGRLCSTKPLCECITLKLFHEISCWIRYDLWTMQNLCWRIGQFKAILFHESSHHLHLFVVDIQNLTLNWNSAPKFCPALVHHPGRFWKDLGSWGELIKFSELELSSETSKSSIISRKYNGAGDGLQCNGNSEMNAMATPVLHSFLSANRIRQISTAVSNVIATSNLWFRTCSLPLGPFHVALILSCFTFFCSQTFDKASQKKSHTLLTLSIPCMDRCEIHETSVKTV